MRVVLKSQEVSVPSLLGRKVPDAGTLAAKTGSCCASRENGTTRGWQPYQSSTSSPAGSLLKTQRSVRVWVSMGPRRLSVPSVEGESLRSGRLTLEQAGVNVGRVLEVTDAAEEADALPAAPARGRDGHVVRGRGFPSCVSRSPGNRDFVMPDLIGRRVEGVVA